MGAVMREGRFVPQVAGSAVSRRLVAQIGACQGCGACLLTCPEHAIRPRAGGLFVVAQQCSGCGECVEVCPVDVIELVEGGDDR